MYLMVENVPNEGILISSFFFSHVNTIISFFRVCFNYYPPYTEIPCHFHSFEYSPNFNMGDAALLFYSGLKSSNPFSLIISNQTPTPNSTFLLLSCSIYIKLYPFQFWRLPSY
ncbi:hypothetical protein AAHE18_05G166800 [Arachis hypogaea]